MTSKEPQFLLSNCTLVGCQLSLVLQIFPDLLSFCIWCEITINFARVLPCENNEAILSNDRTPLPCQASWPVSRISWHKPFLRTCLPFSILRFFSLPFKHTNFISIRPKLGAKLVLVNLCAIQQSCETWPRAYLCDCTSAELLIFLCNLFLIGQKVVCRHCRSC